MSKLREGYGMHLHEGCNQFAVEQGFKNVAGIEHRSYTPIYHDALDCRACLCCAEEQFAPHGQSPRHYWKPELHQGAGGNCRLFKKPLAQGNFDFMKSKYDRRQRRSLGHSLQRNGPIKNSYSRVCGVPQRAQRAAPVSNLPLHQRAASSHISALNYINFSVTSGATQSKC